MAVVNSFDIETVTVQYTAALEMLLQQTDMRIAGSVSQASGYTGKSASPVQYMEPVAFRAAGARGSDVVAQNVGYQRRWVSPQDKDLTLRVDTFDLLRTIVDPKSQLSQNVVAAGNRVKDDVVLDAMFSTAQIGADPASLTTETFDSGSNFPLSVTIAHDFGVGGGATVGLTPKKLVEGRRILTKYENPMSGVKVNIGISSQQESDLLSRMEVISREYREAPVMEDGNIKSFLGYIYHPTERAPFDSSGIRSVPMWLAAGMHLGYWMEMTTVISQQTTKTGHPWQAYSMISLGATRMQGGKLIKCLCDDASGGPLTV